MDAPGRIRIPPETLLTLSHQPEFLAIAPNG